MHSDIFQTKYNACLNSFSAMFSAMMEHNFSDVVYPKGFEDTLYK